MSMDLIVILVLVFVVIPSICLVIYSMIAKKRMVKKQKEQYEKVKHLLDNPDIVKIALWINIDKVNGVEYTGENEYSSNFKNGLLNFHPVSVALFEPGEYRFSVSSNSRSEYQDLEMEVVLSPGLVYQLGCNDRGPYFVTDPNPARYEYKE